MRASILDFVATAIKCSRTDGPYTIIRRTTGVDRTWAMKRARSKKSSQQFATRVGQALRRSAKQARKIARLHGTPIYVWHDGKLSAIKP